jgi:hypothetical protein
MFVEFVPKPFQAPEGRQYEVKIIALLGLY